MRLEIRSASLFLSDLLRLGHSLTDQQLQMFRATLEDLLRLHYHHHWFPESPAKGSGYRCIRINHKMDPMIAKAAKSCGLNDSSLLRNVFPNELTLWIDPREVSYRIGENGSICVLYDGQEAAAILLSSPPQVQQQQQHHQHHHQPNRRQQQQHQLGVHHQNNNNNNSANSSPTSSPSNILDRYSTCKESVRGMDNFIMDRRNLNLDQFAPYVSS